MKHLTTTGGYWSRRVGRRGVLRGATLAAGGLAGAALIGCGDEDEAAPTGTAAPSTATSGAGASATGTTAAAEQPRAGGRLRDYTVSALGGMDPHNAFGGGPTVVQRAYNYLLRTSLFAPQYGVEYDLAESHESPSDGVTWIFKIRPGVKISPNELGIPERDLTAQDVVANYDRISVPGNGATGYQFMNDWVESWDAPDDSTFRLITKGPYSWTVASVGYNVAAVIAPQEFLETGDFATQAVGAGPFMVERVSERAGWAISRNPNYYRADRPLLDSWEWTQFADDIAARTAFIGGELDRFAVSNIRDWKELQKQNAKLQASSTLTSSTNYFTFNLRQEPWTDERARLAVLRGINRQEYLDIVYDGDGRAAWALVPAFVDYVLPDEEIKQLHPFDPADAAKLFQAAGVSEFKYVVTTSTTIGEMANIFTKQMQDAGVSARAEPLDTATWLAVYYDNSFNSTLGGSRTYANPDTMLANYKTNGPFGNETYDPGFADPDVDAAIANAARVLDVDERVEAYKEVQRMLLRDKVPGQMRLLSPNTYELLDSKVRGYVTDSPEMVSAFAHDVWLTS